MVQLCYISAWTIKTCCHRSHQIPHLYYYIQAGKDVLVKAKTGTGKSIAFLVMFTCVTFRYSFVPMFLFNQFIQNGLINSFLQLNQSWMLWRTIQIIGYLQYLLLSSAPQESLPSSLQLKQMSCWSTMMELVFNLLLAALDLGLIRDV